MRRNRRAQPVGHFLGGSAAHASRWRRSCAAPRSPCPRPPAPCRPSARASATAALTAPCGASSRASISTVARRRIRTSGRGRRPDGRQQRIGAVDIAQHLKRQAAGAGAVGGGKPRSGRRPHRTASRPRARRQQAQRALCAPRPAACVFPDCGFAPDLPRDLSKCLPLPRLPASSANARETAMTDRKDLPPAAQRALAEAEERRRKAPSRWTCPSNWAAATAPSRCAMAITRKRGFASISDAVNPSGSARPFGPAAGGQRIGQQAGDGHRPDPARHRRDRAGDLRTALSKSTSPTSRSGRRPPPSTSMRLMPTSITVAPGLIQSPLIISRPPDGGDQISAPRHHRGQIAGARMRDGHRAAFAQQQLRHRLADDVAERPITTAFSPTDRPAGRAAASGSPAACRAPWPFARSPSSPAFRIWKPSTSLAGSMALMTASASICRGQRQLHQNAMHRRIGIQPRDQRQQIGLRGLGGQLVLDPAARRG
jgi:hypothetical protein